MSKQLMLLADKCIFSDDGEETEYLYYPVYVHRFEHYEREWTPTDVQLLRINRMGVPDKADVITFIFGVGNAYFNMLYQPNKQDRDVATVRDFWKDEKGRLVIECNTIEPHLSFEWTKKEWRDEVRKLSDYLDE